MKAAFKYIIIWLAINTFAGVLVYFFGYIVASILGYHFDGIKELVGHPWITSFSLLLCDLLVLLVFWKMKYTRFGFNFGFTYGGDFSAKKLYLWAGVSAIGLLLFDVVSQFYLPIPEDPEIMETLKQMMSNPVGIISVCVLGPISEEVIFRGAIERRLLEKNWNPWYAIVISAIFFAVAHFNFAQGFTATIIGIFMGWVYYRTRSIWPCALIHVVNNSVATLMAVASPEAMYDEDYVLPLSAGIPLFVLGILLIIVAAYFIGKLTKDRTPIPVPVTEVLPPPLPVEATLGTPITVDEEPLPAEDVNDQLPPEF